MSTKPLNLGSGVTYRPPDVHGYPGGVGVVFIKDLGQLEPRSVSVPPPPSNVIPEPAQNRVNIIIKILDFVIKSVCLVPVKLFLSMSIAC